MFIKAFLRDGQTLYAMSRSR